MLWPSRFLPASALVALVLGGAGAWAQSTESDIRNRMVGKHLFLRGAWGENKLTFDASGKPARPYARVSFTEAGMDVDRIHLKPGVLTIEGQRTGLEFDTNGKMKRVMISGLAYDGHIVVEITGANDYNEALSAVFADDLASLVPTLPAYWQSYAHCYFTSPAASGVSVGPATLAPASGPSGFLPCHPPPPGETAAANVGSGVTPPKLLKTVEPQYSLTARMLGYGGSVRLHFWVEKDGSVSHPQIVQAAGLGMDEMTLAAASHFVFQPATRDGKPAREEIYFVVNFR